MNKVFANIEPAKVFHYFEEMSAIPRGSGNMKAISQYFVDFAIENGFAYRQDELGNVVIKKAASAGCEDAPTVMLQGHMDMVCVKNDGVEHDFLTDGLGLKIDGDWLYADGTSLGADDGIAIAYAMAVLTDDSLKTPAIEAVFTVNEEIGLLGASGMDCSDLKSRYIINIDCEDEGIVTCGCAGGLRSRVTLPLVQKSYEGDFIRISITDLTGGHSGCEIQNQRANAIKLMGSLLYRISEATDILLSEMSGGEANNAIPKACTCVILAEDADAAMEAVKTFRTEAFNTYAETDPAMKIEAVVKNEENDVYSFASTSKAIFLLNQIPDGVIRMSDNIPGLPQTSLNVGIVKTGEDLYIESMIRSSKDFEKSQVAEKITHLTEFLGGENVCGEDYPGWDYIKESRLRELCVDTFEKMYKKPMKVDVVHAGLECGIICAKMPGAEAVSIGPDMKDIHTTKERLSIASAARTWDYLKALLAALADER